jgi:hypothetical protein
MQLPPPPPGGNSNVDFSPLPNTGFSARKTWPGASEE